MERVHSSRGQLEKGSVERYTLRGHCVVRVADLRIGEKVVRKLPREPGVFLLSRRWDESEVGGEYRGVGGHISFRHNT